MKTKTIHFNKILAIIDSCVTVEHFNNTKIILKNFFRMHKDLELFSSLNMELTLKLGNVSNTLYLCEQKMQNKTFNVMRSLTNLFKLSNYKYMAAKC